MLSIAEKQVMKRMARLAMLEEDLIQREMNHYRERQFQERPRDELGRWLPKEGWTSSEEPVEESPLNLPRKIKVIRDKEKPHTYDVKETGFNIEDLKSLLAVIGVLATFLYAVFT